MKEFTTAARRIEGEQEDSRYGLEFKIDGEELHALTEPSDGQMAILMASISRHNRQNTQIAGVINFFVSVMDPFTHSYITERLLDPEDDFGMAEVQDILEWLVEEWTGRPTPPPSVSTRSRNNGGRKSTQRTPAST